MKTRVLLLTALTGCSMGKSYDMRAYHSAAAPEPMEEMEAPSGGMVAKETPVAQKPTDKKSDSPSQRMVHYDGYAKLEVTQPDMTLDAAVKLAEDVKGYVESRSSTTVNLRVPYAAVREVYARVLGLGEVMARRLSAQDITDAYLATELRLKTLRTSRARLVELLGAAGEQQKISLLREIQRLSEEIVNLEVQMRTLEQLAVFSRITVEAVPRQAHSGYPVEELQAFRWIHTLSPYAQNVARDADELELHTPANMVLVDDDDVWRAESADGASIWASKRDNEPRGDTAFWLRAVKQRLAQDYPSIEEEQIGKFAVLRIVDGQYRYLVGVLADDDDLQVIEVHYPTKDHEERHGAAVKATIARGES